MGWVIPFHAPLILISDEPSVREQAVRQLVRIGYDDLRGYPDGGMATWEAEGLPVIRVPVMSVQELVHARQAQRSPAVLDVRQDAEWRAGHLPDAIHIEGGRLRSSAMPLSKEERLVVLCGHSARSTVAISLLEQRDYQDVWLLDGGFSAWEKAGYPAVGPTKS